MDGQHTTEIDELIWATDIERSSDAKRRARMGLGVSAAITICWVLWVSIAGHWDRVGSQWASAVTMIFGSFVAGSTPQGGGAVAFPVFTKILEIPSEVARSFSLSIQSIGMTAASIGILINKRPVDKRAIATAAPAAVIGFLVASIVLLDRGKAFGPSIVPGAYVKVTFTVIVAAMAFVTWLGYRNQLLERRQSIPENNHRVTTLLVACAAVGGATSALVGSGADVFVYLAIVAMVGLAPRVGVATSVIVMTIVSLVGFVMYGLFDGHLDVQLSPDREQVTAIGALATSTLPAEQFDLFGLWLAAAPVVAWGAPLGSAVSARATDRQVVKFVVTLAVVEVLSTVIFLDELRTDVALAGFAALFMSATFATFWFANRNRHSLLRLPQIDVSRAITRGSIDVGPKANQQLAKEVR